MIRDGTLEWDQDRITCLDQNRISRSGLAGYHLFVLEAYQF